MRGCGPLIRGSGFFGQTHPPNKLLFPIFVHLSHLPVLCIRLYALPLSERAAAPKTTEATAHILPMLPVNPSTNPAKKPFFSVFMLHLLDLGLRHRVDPHTNQCEHTTYCHSSTGLTPDIIRRIIVCLVIHLFFLVLPPCAEQNVSFSSALQ